MTTFLELLNSSVIMRSVIAAIVIGAASYMATQQITIPDWFQVVLGGVLGYYFGSGTVGTAQRVIRDRSVGDS